MKNDAEMSAMMCEVWTQALEDWWRSMGRCLIQERERWLEAVSFAR